MIKVRAVLLREAPRLFRFPTLRAAGKTLRILQPSLDQTPIYWCFKAQLLPKGAILPRRNPQQEAKHRTSQWISAAMQPILSRVAQVCRLTAVQSSIKRQWPARMLSHQLLFDKRSATWHCASQIHRLRTASSAFLRKWWIIRGSRLVNSIYPIMRQQAPNFMASRELATDLPEESCR